MEKQSWDTFRAVGLLWWVNRILHTFGWSIVTEVDEDTGLVTDVYPARTTWLGFSDESNEQGLSSFQAHINEEVGPKRE